MDDKICMIHLTFAVWLKKYACTVYTVTLYIHSLPENSKVRVCIWWDSGVNSKWFIPDPATTFKSSGTDPYYFKHIWKLTRVPLSWTNCIFICSFLSCGSGSETNNSGSGKSFSSTRIRIHNTVRWHGSGFTTLSDGANRKLTNVHCTMYILYTVQYSRV